MELAEIRPFEPQMAEIDLFTMPDAVGVGEPSVRKIKPYISGHVTDGSSTFTFTVNGNESITIPVDANGKWKWVVDRTVTSLASAFASNLVIDKVEICGLNDITSGNKAFDGARNIKTCTFKNCDASLLTNAVNMFQNMGANYNNELELKLPKNLAPTNCERMFATYRPKGRVGIASSVFKRATNIAICFGSAKVDVVDFSEFKRKNFWYNNQFYFSGTEVPTVVLGTIDTNRKVESTFFGPSNKHISIQSFNVDMELNNCNQLTEQSVVNLFNAVAADGITLTFHATVYAMIQAQLDIEDSPIYNAYWNSDYDFTIISA